MKKLLTALLCILCSQTMAQQSSFVCVLSDSNPVGHHAQAWLKNYPEKSRTFIVDIERQTLVQGPVPESLWGPGQVSADAEYLTIKWYPRTFSVGPKPEVRLFVERKSGFALEGFSYDGSPRVGKKYGEGVRVGSCQISGSR